MKFLYIDLDELAERVADKLAKRNQKGMNVIFREPPKMHYYEKRQKPWRSEC